jgi:hypothetical protein
VLEQVRVVQPDSVLILTLGSLTLRFGSQKIARLPVVIASFTYLLVMKYNIVSFF